MWIFCSFCVMIEKSGKSAGKEKGEKDSQYAAAENPIFQSKNRFLAVSAPENP